MVPAEGSYLLEVQINATPTCRRGRRVNAHANAHPGADAKTGRAPELRQVPDFYRVEVNVLHRVGVRALVHTRQ